jgi:hypothetical protein
MWGSRSAGSHTQAAHHLLRALCRLSGDSDLPGQPDAPPACDGGPEWRSRQQRLSQHATYPSRLAKPTCKARPIIRRACGVCSCSKLGFATTKQYKMQSKKITAALIIDNNSITEWQAESLKHCSDLIEIKLILNCTNTKIPKKPIKNCLYYLLNIASLKSNWTKRKKFDTPKAITHNFESNYRGNWQIIPDSTIEIINNKSVDVVIKFGMSLLKVPENLNTKHGILSFHHGDPDFYRGRPAGFYEMKFNSEKIGTIVQKLSNKLDDGDIYAKSFSKIYPNSYKDTSINFYKNSKYLLRKAVLNSTQGCKEKKTSTGKNYRLPSNIVATLFIIKLLQKKIERLTYGALIEKKWKTAISSFNFESLIYNDINLALQNQNTLIPPPDYVFFADPFISKNGKNIYAEALKKKTGLGDIVSIAIESGKIDKVLLTGSHYSYPQPIKIDSKEYLLPEMASKYSQCFIPTADKSKYIKLEGLENERYVDATHFTNNGVHYIFASPSNESSDILLLFTGDHITGPYNPHPANPIVIDPACARMAGNIINHNGKIYRLGQINTGSYGNGISIMEISEISKYNYKENKIKEVRFQNPIKGPHTINFKENLMVFDYYTENFTPMAGIRRIMNLIGAKKFKSHENKE